MEAIGLSRKGGRQLSIPLLGYRVSPNRPIVLTRKETTIHRFSTYERWEDSGSVYWLVRHKRILMEHGLELVLAFEVRPQVNGTRKARRLTAAERTPRAYQSRLPAPTSASPNPQS